MTGRWMRMGLVALLLTAAGCASVRSFLGTAPTTPTQQQAVSDAADIAAAGCMALDITGNAKAALRSTVHNISVWCAQGDTASVIGFLEQKVLPAPLTEWHGLIWFALHRALDRFGDPVDWNATYASAVCAADAGCNAVLGGQS